MQLQLAEGKEGSAASAEMQEVAMELALEVEAEGVQESETEEGTLEVRRALKLGGCLFADLCLGAV